MARKRTRRKKKPIKNPGLSDWIQFLSQKQSTYSTVIVTLLSLIVALFALVFVLYSIRINLASIYMELYKLNATESSYKSITESSDQIIQVGQFIFNGIIAIIVIIIIVAIFYLRLDKIIGDIMMNRSVDLEQLRVKWFQSRYKKRRR